MKHQHVTFRPHAHWHWSWLISLMLAGHAHSASQQSCVYQPDQVVVLLKLDDVTGDVDPEKNSTAAERWARVTEFLEENKLAASLGIIGDSLERPSPSYVSWLKARSNSGLIEFWNHGYHSNFLPDKAQGERSEFSGTSPKRQFDTLKRTQLLAHSKANLQLKGFGPHNSPVDEATYEQLDLIPEVSYVWFYKPLDGKHHAKAVIERVVELESPIFNPNFEAFQKTYSRRDKQLGYIAMQGHPWAWDVNKFLAFKRVISWLRDQNAVFCSASSYLKSKSNNPS